MTALPVPGWYPDGPDAVGLRWWDGGAWTEHVQLRPDAASSNYSAPGPLSRRELRAQIGPLTAGMIEEPQHSAVAVLEREPEPGAAATPAIAIDPVLSTGDQLRVAGGYPEAEVEDIDPAQRTWKYIPYRRSSQTLQVWLIALAPIWSAAIILPAELFMPTNVFLVGGIAVAGFALLLLLARADSGKLLDRDYSPTSPWWLLLGIVYFIARAVRVGAGGVAPLIGFVLAEVASVALIFFVVMTVMGVPLSAVLH